MSIRSEIANADGEADAADAVIVTAMTVDIAASARRVICAMDPSLPRRTGVERTSSVSIDRARVGDRSDAGN
jgi:hypothetical protein